MSGKPSLKCIRVGDTFDIYSMDMGQDCDYHRKYKELEKVDQVKVAALIKLTANRGPGKNKEKWRKLKKGLFEIKSHQVRIPFFYHSTWQGIIVLTHIFIKKRGDCPPGELERALERKKIGDSLEP